MECLKDNELAVFFRNNHFNTIFKHGRCVLSFQPHAECFSLTLSLLILV